ncbi:MAG TPA: xanthine dehydrogenase family protein molybdopterin-binding subunit [bacterium]|nr:xanthine dehydrogenase family protein molybdopterin-binding subunit [bacterium]
MKSPTSWIGRPLRRVEDPKFLRGEATYVDDLVLPGLAHVVFVRSPVAHGALRAVDTDPARAAPGVMAILTAADLAGRVTPVVPAAPEGAQIARAPHSILAADKVRYVGEPVAAVLAETRRAAEDAAAFVALHIDPLPAVTTTAQAYAAETLLHDDAAGNVLMQWSHREGDVDAVFAGAAHVVSQSFHIPRLAPAPIESRGAVAVYDPGMDLLTVWCSMQDPHRPRGQLSRILSRPDDRIRVIIPDVGGAFGSKGHVPPETAVTALLAIAWGRPVKWVEDRRENLAATYQGRGLDVDMALALDRDGHILAIRARVLADLGAYLYPATAQVPITTSMLLTGTYAIPAVSVETLGMATNKVPTGPYRGAGRPEAAYLVERMVDLAAHEMALDPVELRRRNLVPPDRFPYRSALGFTYDSGDYPRALGRACELIGYDQRRREQSAGGPDGRLLGVGVTMYLERAGAQLWESAALTVSPSGRVIVRLGSTPTGQAHETTFAQIAADVLQVDIGAITVEHGDSAIVPRGVGTFGSRSTTVGGSALFVAAQRVKAKATRIAAHLLEAAAEDLQWADGLIYVAGAPDRHVTFADVAAAAFNPVRLPRGIEMGLDEHAIFRLPAPVFPYGAYAAVVEVDPDTGHVAVLDFVAVDDIGRVVNPLTAEGQVIGGVIQGLGEAFTEAVVYDDDGQLLTATFADYGMPRADAVPTVRSEFLETPSPLNPLGIKGVGEAGSIAAPAVIASAVHDALRPLGVRHLDFPFTPARIWEAIRRLPL